MSISFVQACIVTNVLFVIALGIAAATKAWSAQSERPILFRSQLRLTYALLGAALIAPWLALTTQSTSFLPEAAQVWSAPSMHIASAPTADDRHATISFAAEDAGMSLTTVTQTMLASCLVGLAFALVRVAAGAFAARRLIGRAQLFREAGSIRVFVSDEVDVPFSFWTPGSYFIVVPASLILRPDDLRVAVRHEGQHHRQGDTRLLYLLQLLRGVFFWNPAVHLLCRHVRELQEFACDEAIAGRSDVAASDYCATLLRVAQNALGTSPPDVCVRMAGEQRGDSLLRRVAAILQRPEKSLHKPAVAALNVLAVAAIILTGVVLPGTVQDRRITLDQANAMAEVARKHSSFPIVVNAAVVKELNRLMGTPDGRAFVRAGLRRMSEHEALITRKLDWYGLPTELLAVPIMESGYRNLPPSDNPAHGAGIWMFIVPTARQFGLTIDEHRDDRLDLSLETEAAMRFFARLHTEFDDWPLALLAYNAGVAKVARGIRETGSRDAFHLVQNGYENDAGYLPRVMAAIIVLKNAQQI